MGKFFWFVLPVLIALSLVYFPSIWVYTAMIIDFYTPWVLFESPLYDKYHEFLVSRLAEKPEIPLPEITAAEATYERLKKDSHGFSFPIVIRGLLGNTTGVQKWGNHDWWIQNYGSEEMLCGTLAQVVENCTVGAFFDAIKHGRPFYISGASEIVERHPELHEMIDNEAIRSVEPGRRTATQIFMGLPQMGSDIHCAIGINIFRMVAGQKKWWFIPPSETVYLKPAINVNGFSCHTHTKVGKEGEAQSPWLSKLVRYTTVLNPGDILFNPPWYWHGILNLGDRSKGDLVIGSPSRYGGKGVENRRADGTPAALKTNWLFTVHAFFTLWRKYGSQVFQPDFKMRLQADIANNRRDREHKALVGEDPDVNPLD